MITLRVLIVGRGGREHALAWKMRQSPLVSAIYGTKPNAGMTPFVIDVGIAPSDVAGLVRFATYADLGLVVIGPEAPLAAGLADRLRDVGVVVVGPSQAAARLESSKWFGKTCMREAGISTPSAILVQSYEAAQEALARVRFPIVIKADGLAFGKGVRICHSYFEALETLTAFMRDRIFGEAGSAVLLEEFVSGPELSLFALVSGQSVLPFGSCQDYKRLLDGDFGPNTGGMGSISPASGVSVEQEEDWTRRLVVPLIKRLAEMGIEYRGFLYAGVILTNNGPMVLEINVRLGDPETQSLLPRCKSDIVPALLAVGRGQEIHSIPLDWSSCSTVSVVAAANGYPDEFLVGGSVIGLGRASSVDGTYVFHGGTDSIRNDGDEWNPTVSVSGGRVLTVTGIGNTFSESRDLAYRTMEMIHFEGKVTRTDIGAASVGVGVNKKQ